MASIAEWIQKIKTAIYGEEVRGAIWQSLQAMNDELTSADVTQIPKNKQDIAGLKTGVTTVQGDVNTLKSDVSTVKTDVTNLKASDAELKDIRVGADGTTYASAGNAVREQVNGLNGRLTQQQNVVGIVPLTMEKGGLNFRTDGPPTASSYNSNWRARTPINNPISLPTGALIAVNTGYKAACIAYNGSTYYANNGWISGTNRYEITADSTCWIYVALEVESGDAVDAKTLSDSIEILIPNSHSAKIQNLESDLDESTNTILQMDSEIGIINATWEMGSLNATAGDTEPTNSSYGAEFRLRTPVRSPVSIKAGNTVTVGAGYKFSVIYNGGTGIVVIDWMTGSWCAPVDCNMWVIIRKYGEDKNPIPYYTLKNTVIIRKNSDMSLSDRVTELEALYPDGTDGNLPDYYYENGWYSAKLEEVQTASKILNGIVFPFVTDIHFNANSKNSKYLLKSVLDNTSCDFVVAGGDYGVTGATAVESRKCISDLLEYASYIGHEKWFALNGNHDFTGSENLTWGETYNAIFRPSERWAVDMNAGGYFCIDNKAQKTRIICLNSCMPSPVKSVTVMDGLVRIGYNQSKYLIDKINEVSNYKIIVISHIASDSAMFAYQSNMSGIQTILELLANKQAGSITAGAVINIDFTNTTNKLICHISGHSHKDESHVSNNVLSIATTCDACYRDDGHEAVVGTVTEQAFDVYCIDYDAETITAVRIGRGASRKWAFDGTVLTN